MVPLQLLEYAFGDRTAVVEFIPGAQGVRVKVTFDAETEHPVEQQQEGWQSILNHFRKHVESAA